MPRPPRNEEATAAISAYYSKHWAMPTIEGLAQATGCWPTASAYGNDTALVKEVHGNRTHGGR
jgi:hypothetical protein|nr:hypothetical protein [Rhodoferax sp.]